MSDTMLIRSLFRDYNVHFIEDFTSAISQLVEKNAFFIVDALVWEIYRERMTGVIPDSRCLIVEANEKNKTLYKSGEIIEILVDRQVRRNEQLVAIGGGIIQDVTAFSASIIYRGIGWSFFPTTLLAQADSCIGSKTSINLGNKKNMVGNFYPPSEIYIDTVFLTSLTEADILSGIGEMLHYYYYAASPFFEKIIAERPQILSNRRLLMDFIRESLQIKKSVIEIDEFDREERNKFNYGHTFGHALESLTDYAVKHGQAVTMGMDIANYISLRHGIMSVEEFDRAHTLLVKNFPDYEWRRFDMGRYTQFLSKDKKNIGSDLVCILAERPGLITKQRISMDETFRDVLQKYFSAILPSTINHKG